MSIPIRRVARYLLLWLVVALVSACSSTATTPPTNPQSQIDSGPSALPARPTHPPNPQSPPQPAADTSTSQPISALTSELEATPLPTPPPVTGETILTLGRGNGADQIGANATFRIGADGSIRILDSDNKRLLFFNGAGKFQNMRPLPEANNPQDFIVANTGEMFVLDFAGDTPDRVGRVLHYNADDSLNQRIAISENLFASNIMLNATNDLILGSYHSYWVIRHNNVLVPPQIQPLTMHNGVITPRSPLVFLNEFDTVDRTIVRIQSPTDVNTTSFVMNVPSQQSLFNVDRAMNLYTTSYLSNASSDGINVWRYAPYNDGVALGGAQINDTLGCDFGTQADRRFYIDQAGAAWTLCLSASGARINRYTLVDASGVPLPAAASEPADVPWKPGATFRSG